MNQPNDEQDDVKKTLYIDMDNTLVDFRTRLEGIAPSALEEYTGRFDEIPGVFAVIPVPTRTPWVQDVVVFRRSWEGGWSKARRYSRLNCVGLE